MPSEKQRSAARKNIRKAASAARKKRTIAQLPQSNPDCAGEAGVEGRAGEAESGVRR